MTEESLFAAALERHDPAEREAFLEEACGSNTEMLQHVRELLQCHAKADHFLAQPALAPPARSSAEMAGSASHPTPGGNDVGAVLRLLQPSQRPGSLGRLKHYEVLQVLGQGAFGTVLKVFDEQLHRVVAIKVLAPELAANSTSRLRFLREARAAAAVRHENVIDIHGVDEGPTSFLIMGYISGQTLQQKLDRCGPLPVKEILRIGTQVAAGLAAAHRQGLIHRDIKPSNILLENGVERVKLSDFGLARAADDASLTQMGLIAGTPHYMSPEQAEGKYVDQRSDLFSLGSVLYALCTGSPPFRADSSLAVLRRVSEATPRPVRDCNPEVPEWLAVLIGALHARNPDERLQSAQELADLLAMRLAEMQLLGSGNARPSMARQEEREKVREKSLALYPRVLGAVAIFGIVCALGFWLGIAKPWRGIGSTDEPGSPQGTRPAEHQQVSDAGVIPVHRPGPLRKVPDPADLAGKASAADGLDPKAISEVMLQTLFRDPHAPPPGLVAVLGDDHFLLPRGAGEVMRMDPSPDGKLLAVPKGNIVVVYETSSGKLMRTLQGPGTIVRRVVFSPDSKLLAAVGLDGDSNRPSPVRIWDLARDWEVLEREQPPTLCLYTSCINFTADGKNLITSGEIGRPLYVADVRTGAMVKEIAIGPGRIPNVGQSGKLLAVVDYNSNRVVLWDTETWQEVKTWTRTLSGVGDVAVSPDGKLIALGSAIDVKLCSVETGATIHQFRTAGHSVVFAPDGKSILSWGTDSQVSHVVTRWDVQSGEKVGQFTVSGPEDVFFPRLSRDGTQLYLTYQHRHVPYVVVIDAVTGGKRPRLGHSGPVNAVAISPDAQRLASAGADGTVRLWALDNGQQQLVLTGHQDMVLSVAFSPDGNLVASGSADGTVRLWEVGSGKELSALNGARGIVRQVVFAPGGAVLAAASQDGAIRLWDVKDVRTGGFPSLLHKIGGGDESCWGIDFSPDGKSLAGGCDDTMVRLWDVQTGKLQAQLSGHTSRVRSVAFRPDGQILVSTGDELDRTIRQWDLAALKQVGSPQGQDVPALSTSWRADGGLLVTCGGNEGTVGLWDMTVQPARLVGSKIQVGPHPYGVALTPEGRYLAAANDAGAICVYQLTRRGVRFPN